MDAHGACTPLNVLLPVTLQLITDKHSSVAALCYTCGPAGAPVASSMRLALALRPAHGHGLQAAQPPVMSGPCNLYLAPQVGLYLPQDYNSAAGLLRAMVRAMVRDGDDYEEVSAAGGQVSWGQTCPCPCLLH
jgi:hypothetical protein